MSLGVQGTLNCTLSPREQMSFCGMEHYWKAGQSALACIEDGLRAAGRPEVGFDGAPYGVWTILDLPCGQGRVLRHLRRGFPQARITASDLEREGVEFCAATFDAIPLHSNDDPSKLPLPVDHFDLIWVGSLFTHVDAPKWDLFLESFRRALRPRGVLVFTTHGNKACKNMKRRGATYGHSDAELDALTTGYDQNGFAYGRYTGLDWNYGTSLSSLNWVSRRIEDSQGLQLVHAVEEGWDRHQDCYTCVRTD
ncbi:class I SAM-dependent methyltransferase [Paludisphaera rhizosphaerae]|uniref:class I SAM-dependent methyltransferase n=1 Tax=Paludisphaera rhizosphaerae TaxID=2711216 RepID=UPI0013EC8AE9|nr:class I SAM-dependent methyltransferase [Paludisphaera rhizosphaerae]